MKEKYKKLHKVTYGDGYFEAGTMTGSKHKENTHYLDINDTLFELTEDEFVAIAHVITGTLWSEKSAKD